MPPRKRAAPSLWDYSHMSTKRQSAYRRAARACSTPLAEFLSLAASGSRFCRTCKLWKPLDLFHKLPSPASVTGVCRLCKSRMGDYVRPEGLLPRFWGPYVRAAKKLGLDPQEYYAHRQANEHYCMGCKSWFPAHGGEGIVLEIRDQYCNTCRDAQVDHGKGKRAYLIGN